MTDDVTGASGPQHDDVAGTASGDADPVGTDRSDPAPVDPRTVSLPAAEARVLFVHAHPDDESILTGGTMAALAAAGAEVVLLTATRGEGGEVIGEEHSHLFGDRAGLAAHRERELAAAMRALGVRDHRFLGDGARGGAAHGLPARRFEDSGMEWGPDGHAVAPEHMPEAALCRASVDEVAAYISQVVAEVRPHLVITYPSGGGYGHPDHRHVHLATVAALEGMEAVAGTDALDGMAQPPVLLFADVPDDVARAAFDPSRPGFDLTGFAPARTIPTIPASAPIAVAQDVDAVLGAKAMAMAAHATQVTVAGEFFALSNGIGQHIADTEYYTLAGAGTEADADTGAESDGEARPASPKASVLDMVALPAAVTVASGAGSAGAAGAAGTAHPGDAGPDAAHQGGTRRRRGSRGKPGIGALLHVILFGLLIGGLGAFQHLNATAVDVAGTTVVVPWGLAISLAMTAAGLWHIAALYRSAGHMVLTAAIISALGFVLSQPAVMPGSDLVVTGSLRSIGWLFGPMIIAAIMAFTLPSLRPSSSKAGRPRR